MLHLGSIGRTSIDIDFSFLIVVGLWVTMAYRPEQGIHYALLWIPVLFISVLVHELAHAAMIGALGFGHSQIILGGMGGVTINERRAKPWQDFLISAVGPLSSWGLALGLAYLFSVLPVMRTDKMLVALVPLLIRMNVFWAIFNSIPVPPLDGGMAMRSFLRMFLREKPAFLIAVWIAILGGAAIAVYAALNGSFFIALFVGWFAFQNYQAWQYFRDHGIPGD
jgi:stage IV sporulation protein FB